MGSDVDVPMSTKSPPLSVRVRRATGPTSTWSSNLSCPFFGTQDGHRDAFRGRSASPFTSSMRGCRSVISSLRLHPWCIQCSRRRQSGRPRGIDSLQRHPGSKAHEFDTYVRVCEFLTASSSFDDAFSVDDGTRENYESVYQRWFSTEF